MLAVRIGNSLGLYPPRGIRAGLELYPFQNLQSKNYGCTESYLREEKLAEAFAKLLAGTAPEEVRAKDSLQAELDKLIRLSVAVRGNNDNPEGVNVGLLDISSATAHGWKSEPC